MILDRYHVTWQLELNIMNKRDVWRLRSPLPSLAGKLKIFRCLTSYHQGKIQVYIRNFFTFFELSLLSTAKEVEVILKRSKKVRGVSLLVIHRHELRILFLWVTPYKKQQFEFWTLKNANDSILFSLRNKNPKNPSKMA